MRIQKSLIIKALFSVWLLIVLTSCLSNRKIIYLQNLNTSSEILFDDFIPFGSISSDYRLMPHDIVDIDFSSIDDELIQVFEFRTSRNFRQKQTSNVSSGDLLYFSGYSIDENGEIEMPIVGRIKIAGKTESEAQLVIQQEINKFFKEEVLVRLNLGGIHFTTLGEFKNPGFKTIMKNRVTILEAIAISGEANLFADRREMYIIRQYLNGSKIHQVNLNDRALLASPYYFIQPNDVLYLKPLKSRQLGRNDSLASSISTILSIASSGIFLGVLIFK